MRVSFAALDGGSLHASFIKNVDTGAIWRWSLDPVLPQFRWFFVAAAMLLAIWAAISLLAGEPSRRLAPYAFTLGIAPVFMGMALRLLRRRRLTSLLRAEMEDLTHG